MKNSAKSFHSTSTKIADWRVNLKITHPAKRSQSKKIKSCNFLEHKTRKNEQKLPVRLRSARNWYFSLFYLLFLPFAIFLLTSSSFFHSLFIMNFHNFQHQRDTHTHTQVAISVKEIRSLTVSWQNFFLQKQHTTFAFSAFSLISSSSTLYSRFSFSLFSLDVPSIFFIS